MTRWFLQPPLIVLGPLLQPYCKQECIPAVAISWGCLPREVSVWGVSAQGVGVCPGGMSAQRVSAQGGCLPPEGVSAHGVSGWGVCQTPPVDRMTDACENITFLQLLLRTVKISTQFQIWISRLEHLICTQRVRYGSIKQLQYNKRTECKEGNHSSGTIHINDCRISVKGIRCGLVYKYKRLELIVDGLVVHVCDDCGLTD